MSKQELIAKLKTAKGVKVTDKGFIEFDKNSDLEFQVLEHFRLKEFLTKNTKDTYTLINVDVMLILDRIRRTWNKPLSISSSYRSPSYNKSIKGATSSQHILGNAVDLHPSLKDIKAFQEVVEEMNLVAGVGYYNTFVHIDSRGKRARWDERK